MRQFNQEELVEKIRSERRHMNELYAQISELKQENSNLKDYVKSLKDECISCPEKLKVENEHFESNMKNVLEIEKKHAQIDILNRLKEKLEDYEDHCLEMHDWQGQTAICECEEYIDELIKEIENDNSKSN